MILYLLYSSQIPEIFWRETPVFIFSYGGGGDTQIFVCQCKNIKKILKKLLTNNIKKIERVPESEKRAKCKFFSRFP